MSTNAPATINNPTALSVINEDMFSDTRIEMIRNSVAKGAPPDVFLAMIDIAKRRNLDPLAKQIICAKFGSTWQTIVTIDGYRSIAEQTGHYAGSDAPVFTYPDDDKRTPGGKRIPESATVTVYKMISGVRAPFSATVYWEEYAGINNWLTMPRTMLAKVAESHALRKAFPSVLSGTYTQEEMDQARSQDRVDTFTGEVYENIDDLARKRSLLLDDPQPGLAIWQESLASVSKRITNHPDYDPRKHADPRQTPQNPRRAPEPITQASVSPTDDQEALIDAWEALDQAMADALPASEDEERADIVTAAFAKAGIRDLSAVPLKRIQALTAKLEAERDATVEWLTTTYNDWAELNSGMDF